ncbi:conserved hypothetical protein [Myxococcus xanthus DK 1622]|uniref:DUF2326 domain-containing protein n=1 Tax=Myxococcus xanthus (strain DK1622) TaxID=246197 RepID=Q1DB23_MYXXD|nr:MULTISPECIES: DUF2326 domain-containing protein [Myxococcus]ABF88115.1 conserved hypothetical protein [Myxococcus xanthus DK 1622]NOJ54836.1 DUF2326 domain-containing protein [Myxococcus xanthus]QPM81493.1 DUF2326 domain-containing protein [Myxococcus xanthus]QVW70743.1 DUF2326 domain-containing protein [Myxococcus xanthus DZ2]QZZ49653.1 hypothetical protein MyxoNM_10590 [Myxococcus xanthus]
MKLSRIYSNRPAVFGPVDFLPGLSVVFAEIRLPQNRTKDTHNLGKTTLGRLVDFCLLSGRDPRFFLFKHRQMFDGFVFLIEIELLDGSYVTVRRGVSEPTKVAFKRHHARSQNYAELPVAQWDHVDVPFERAKDLLDGILDLRAISPWSYRRALGYLLRTQDDYRDVFQLRNGHKHVDWKPFLAHVLGFNSAFVEGLYRKEAELSEKQSTVQAIRAEIGSSVEDVSKVEGMLLLKQKEAEKKQGLLNAFDFRGADKERTRAIADDVDARIAVLNAERYSLAHAKRKIDASLEEEQVLFDPDDAQRLFAEVGVTFPGQLKKDYEQLISFNRAITDERRQYLQEERIEIEASLKRVAAELAELGRRRSEMLAFLTGTDVFAKYRRVSEELVGLNADITSLERQRGYLHRLQEMRTEIRTLTDEKGRLQTEVEKDVEVQNSDGNSLFSSIRIYFSEIVEDVIDRKALLSVAPNQQGHLEFRAEILDESGNATSADLGHTYRKLLCVAFDMAVLRAGLDKRAPRFVYHDGVFESLDDRKKTNLLAVMRKYANIGLQFVVTLIDSELPARAESDGPMFADGEIVLRLHDEGPEGRLFKMAAW